MNKKLIPLLLVLVALFQGCTGPEGPQGPEGGSIDVTGTTFDLVNVNFTPANEWLYSMSYADAKVTVLESDAVLIYIHWGDVTSGGEKVKAFRLLPQTAFLDEGILSYNFDQTKKDFSIFLDGTVNLANLADDWTKNQNFRIIIVPADFAARKSGSVDYNDYNAVIKEFNIDESKIRTVSAQ
ncbi:hypothetical protein [Dyadobacter pollutisoli]|jgi:hypothetical protein|uniref:Collagen-like protein n=1 Tax=Dyadobacter pollutisoli TaxID=2910158 RepID=A0A9E8ND95_9BACT|nr:hypothetical protein [Dyadobacter pollutisoli]WAC12877.1 hypothetical protein ON006_02705 [Dyadobacter pollutisoli]